VLPIPRQGTRGHPGGASPSPPDQSPPNHPQRVLHHHAAAPPLTPRPRHMSRRQAGGEPQRCQHGLSLPLPPGESGSMTCVALPAAELQSRRDALHKAYVTLSNPLERWTAAYVQAVIPLAAYQRRRRDLDQTQQGLQTQQLQLAAQVDRQSEMAGMVTSCEAFCQRVRRGLTKATFEQKRTLVDLL